MLTVRIKQLSDNSVFPRYATPGSAAVDLSSAESSPVTIEPGARVMIHTGLAIAPDSDRFVAILAARSGLACKHGLALSNGIGVIDSDYRGEICVSLFNSGSESYTVEPGERVAQMMFLPVEHADLVPADTLDVTERGEGGFGSTGR